MDFDESLLDHVWLRKKNCDLPGQTKQRSDDVQ